MTFLHRAAALVLAAASVTAHAAFPNKPIRLVIGFPAGGPLDQHAHLLSDRLQAVLGQPLMIDYKAGAGGTVGAQEVMKAAPDGSTLMLAVTSRELNPALPGTPTVIESGLKNFEVVGFYGFLAPAGLPKDVTAKLSDAFRKVLTSPDIRNRMISQGADPAFLGSEDFGKFLASEMPRWAQAVQKSGAKVD